MKGFYIFVKNELLEPKHVEQMGVAVWLYMWLLDAITSVNENGIGKVKKSRPISSAEIQAELGISDKTYRRWANILEEHGYINTIRAPYGIIFTVNKAKKVFGQSSATSDRTEELTPKKKRTVNTDRTPKTDRSNMTEPDSTFMTELSDKNDRTNNNKTVTRHNKQDILPTVAAELPMLGESLEIALNDTLPDMDLLDPLTSNALKPSSARKTSDPEIDLIIQEFQRQFDIRLKRMRNQRQMAHHLRNRYGREQVVEMITVARAVRDEQYAPQILDIQDLWEKWDKLMSYGRRHITAQSKRVANITEDEG